jgi:hypothetical protein
MNHVLISKMETPYISLEVGQDGNLGYCMRDVFVLIL